LHTRRQPEVVSSWRLFEVFNLCVVGGLGTLLGPLAAANFDRCGYRIQEGQVFGFVDIVLQDVPVWAQGLDMCAELPSVVKNLFCL
jgi:ABC-type branched-subunit amino acid transport system permease subunit